VIIFAQLSLALSACPAHFHLADLSNFSAFGSFVCSLTNSLVTLFRHVMPKILRSIANCLDLILLFRAFVIAHVSAA